MKRLWIAALLLAVLFGATLCNNLYLRGFTGALNTLLEQVACSASCWRRLRSCLSESVLKGKPLLSRRREAAPAAPAECSNPLDCSIPARFFPFCGR